MTKTRLLTLLLGAALVASCGDSANQVIAGPEPGAGTRVRFFNFGVNAPGVHFYANDTKVAGAAEVGFTQDPKLGTATGGTESVTGTAVGGVTSGGYYNSIAAGAYTFNARIAAATDNGLKVANLNTTLASGKKYSVFLSGLYDAVAKTSDAFIVEDAYPETYDWNNVMVRFVNSSYNSSPMTLYAKNQTTLTETAVGADVAYKGAGVFVTLPPGTYDFRAALGSTNPFTRTAVSLTAGRVYTITARGSATVAGGASGSAALDNTANR
jgi:Domain of unknown function (DUF4397)